MHIKVSNIENIIFDFDGVLTDNRVWVTDTGHEMVSCSRSDGLAFDVLRKVGLNIYIVSTELNPVVSARADKLKVPVIQGTKNKATTLKQLADKKNLNLNKTIFVGNDLNDFRAMEMCGYSLCPMDSHEKIKLSATYCLESRGGMGVAREIVERVLKLNTLEILYPMEGEQADVDICNW